MNKCFLFSVFRWFLGAEPKRFSYIILLLLFVWNETWNRVKHIHTQRWGWQEKRECVPILMPYSIFKSRQWQNDVKQPVKLICIGIEWVKIHYKIGVSLFFDEIRFVTKTNINIDYKNSRITTTATISSNILFVVSLNTFRKCGILKKNEIQRVIVRTNFARKDTIDYGKCTLSLTYTELNEVQAIKWLNDFT